MFKTFLLIFFFTSTTMLASNHLGSETSPYLLQHKNNPVDWYPWGDEAFDRAKKENKLIFLSIGYSTCHWCHVMAHESFEDGEVAKVLNESYISIKMDKEQYPHIDRYYQNIYQLMNKKGGGWPLTIVLTPDKKPFFSATYIPRDKGYGSNGLIDILTMITQAKPQELDKIGTEVLRVIDLNDNRKFEIVEIDKTIHKKTIKQFKDSFDFKDKGFSIRPKFPHASSITLLLKLHEITKSKEALDMATSTLDAMALGGIYDQIEGGFYRYSVDERWEIPHFEKMLYTNSELIESYAEAYKLTKEPLYKKVIVQTIAQMDKRFGKDGVYMSASNADSKTFEGHNEEGFYFVYDYDDTQEYLQENNISSKDSVKALQYFGIIQDGNFDGDASNPRITTLRVSDEFDKAREILVKMREKKEYPSIDNKINTAWNAQYIRAKFLAGDIDSKFIDEASHSLDELLKILYIDGTLYHQTIKGVKPTQKALLEDFAFLGSCLFEAYQKTLDDKYWMMFEKIVQTSIVKFYKDGRWIESVDGFKSYASLDDKSYASDLSINLINLIKYATLEASSKILNIVKETLKRYSSQIDTYPSYHPSATQLVLMLKQSPVFIKSNEKNLKKIDINTINHPFLYRYISKGENYLACRVDSCFSYSKDFEIVKKAIEKYP